MLNPCELNWVRMCVDMGWRLRPVMAIRAQSPDTAHNHKLSRVQRALSLGKLLVSPLFAGCTESIPKSTHT